MRDYQYKKIKEYILPEAVYRQALWAARDMGRLMEKLAEARDRLGETVPSNMGYKHNRRLSRSDPTYGQAREMINLALRIEGIERALDTVPADFRKGIRKKCSCMMKTTVRNTKRPYGKDGSRFFCTMWP